MAISTVTGSPIGQRWWPTVSGPRFDDVLVVLRDYSPVDQFRAVFQPSNIGVADFNGDGLQDVYEWTDQGDGFRTYLNTPDSQLVAGPVQFCFGDGPRGLELADLDGDGATDVVIAYSARYCAEGSSRGGVVVVLDDGTVVQLQDEDIDVGWSAAVVDADGDGVPDVKTVNGDSGEVTHFLGNGDGTFTPAPSATDDTARVRRKGQTVVRVLDNEAATTSATITIVTPPRYGTVTVTPERDVVYRHTRGHRRTDTFVYQLTDDGKTATATVSVRINS